MGGGLREKIRPASSACVESAIFFAQRSENRPKRPNFAVQGEFCRGACLIGGLLGEFCRGVCLIGGLQGEFCRGACLIGGCWASFFAERTCRWARWESFVAGRCRCTRDETDDAFAGEN